MLVACVVNMACSSSWLWADRYPLELLTHFQWQYFLAGVTGLILLLLLRRPRMSMIGVVAVLMPGLTLLPYSPLGRGVTARQAVADESHPTLRIMLANVLTHNRRVDDLLVQMTEFDPDIVVLQEIDRWWVEALEDTESAYPYRAVEPRADNFGLLVLSRIPMADVELFHGEAARLPSAVASFVLDGRPLRMATTHPLPPMGVRNQSSRDAQLRRVKAHLCRERELDDPLILIGDLNTTPWSPIYREVVSALHLRNAREGRGVLPTWPTHLPGILRIPIDHILLTDDFVVEQFRLGEEFGSDHLPVFVEVSWR